MKKALRLTLRLAPLIWLGASGCQTPVTPTSSANNRSEIILQAGDVIKVSFPGAPQLDTPDQPIRRDGKVTVPLAGEVMAAGLTPTELQQRLLDQVGNQLITKEVTVTVVSSTYSVYVDGPVLRPGKLTIDRPITALEAIMEAGGFDYSKANTAKVVIIRHQSQNQPGTSFIIDLKPVLEGKEKDTFYLAPGDIVHVPEKFNWF